MDIAPNNSTSGWSAVVALDGLDMYVRADSEAEVQRVLNSVDAE